MRKRISKVAAAIGLAVGLVVIGGSVVGGIALAMDRGGSHAPASNGENAVAPGGDHDGDDASEDATDSSNITGGSSSSTGGGSSSTGSNTNDCAADDDDTNDTDDATGHDAADDDCGLPDHGSDDPEPDDD